MSLSSLADYNIDQIDMMYKSDDFKNIIEQNLDYIVNSSTNENGFLQTAEVPDNEAAACEGDFRKVCAFLGIPIHMSWIVMRVNGLMHFAEYKRELTHILIPDYSLIYGLGLKNAVTQTNI